ncbi:GTP cyclohydrolase I [Cruoricaptor ignavus]|uniref:GTP cyclohydrolase 1 n=1 Tax=Cruoricaptor ignavus TaxID=1118202 RepID=A0A1M6G6J0_9FLAO|nr:GTP cyclohydrolase I FolE [Cruoricaptor ignavus]SHJ05530.1 GTP cyclohydrolase I [Cruoricaptor ignavus]
MKYSKDAALGNAIKEYLVEKGVETPVLMTDKSNTTKIRIIEKNFTNIMKTLGLDLSDDSLKDSPHRVAKMFVNEIFYGLDYGNFPKATAVENKMKYNEVVLVKNISITSTCEHHFVTIDGKCHIAYIPKEKVIGLSKINRIAKFFAKRPQIQERLSEQIYYALSFILETEDIAVIIDAEHYCVKSRGIEDISSSTTTSKIGGVFLDDSARAELIGLIK